VKIVLVRCGLRSISGSSPLVLSEAPNPLAADLSDRRFRHLDSAVFLPY